ncbi:MAG: type II toxin-antitoxin system Phd/YefM family antitoxin, partial [Desulfobacterales bacterium]
MTNVNIVQGKRDFSRLIQMSNETDSEIIVTRRGAPVAVLISYDHYQRLKRVEGYRRILQARERFTSEGIRADEVYK